MDSKAKKFADWNNWLVLRSNDKHLRTPALNTGFYNGGVFLTSRILTLETGPAPQN